MSHPTVPARPAARHGWAPALAAVLTGLAVMVLVATLGLLAAGAAALPDGAFPRVVPRPVVTAVGGSVDITRRRRCVRRDASRPHRRSRCR
ncbi:hypothetical protein [Streptomyces echinatus]|uniref:hypothetical protein n=1 Tax=Streptomyces echinatus TaxID=67293 RepID=UPI0031EB59A9